jgi:acylphosphatase
MPATPTSRATIHYAGHVQGVGFRYAVVQTAKGFEVTGFVENLPDGRVRVTAEGEAAEIDEFAKAIADRMIGYIRQTTRTDEVGPRQHQGFFIR